MKNVFENIDSVVGFNTDDGIRRATTEVIIDFCIKTKLFQYR